MPLPQVISWPAGSYFSGTIGTLLICEQQPDKRPARVSAGYARSYSKSWFVRTLEYGLDQFFVGAMCGIYTGYYLYQPYPADPGAVVVDIEVNPWPGGDGTTWEVIQQFSTNPETTVSGGGIGAAAVSHGTNPHAAGQQQGLSPSERVDNPLTRMADISISAGSYSMATDTDVDGNLITNVLKFPYTPVRNYLRPEVVIQVGFNMAVPMTSLWLSNLGAVNLNTWVVGEYFANPLCGCLKDARSNRVFDGTFNIKYYRWSLTIHIRKPFYGKSNQRFLGPLSMADAGPWDRYEPNIGLEGVDMVTNNRKIRLRDVFGSPLTTPMMLDANGVPTQITKYRVPATVDDLNYYRVFKDTERVTWPDIT